MASCAHAFWFGIDGAGKALKRSQVLLCRWRDTSWRANFSIKMLSLRLAQQPECCDILMQQHGVEPCPTLMAASMQPKGRQTPAGVLKSALAATLASSAHAAALAPQFLGVAFSSSTIFAFFSCNRHALLVSVQSCEAYICRLQQEILVSKCTDVHAKENTGGIDRMRYFQPIQEPTQMYDSPFLQHLRLRQGGRRCCCCFQQLHLPRCCCWEQHAPSW